MLPCHLPDRTVGRPQGYPFYRHRPIPNIRSLAPMGAPTTLSKSDYDLTTKVLKKRIHKTFGCEECRKLRAHPGGYTWKGILSFPVPPLHKPKYQKSRTRNAKLNKKWYAVQTDTWSTDIFTAPGCFHPSAREIDPGDRRLEKVPPPPGPLR